MRVLKPRREMATRTSESRQKDVTVRRRMVECTTCTSMFATPYFLKTRSSVIFLFCHFEDQLTERLSEYQVLLWAKSTHCATRRLSYLPLRRQRCDPRTVGARVQWCYRVARRAIRVGRRLTFDRRYDFGYARAMPNFRASTARSWGSARRPLRLWTSVRRAT